MRVALVLLLFPSITVLLILLIDRLILVAAAAAATVAAASASVQRAVKDEGEDCQKRKSSVVNVVNLGDGAAPVLACTCVCARLRAPACEKRRKKNEEEEDTSTHLSRFSSSAHAPCLLLRRSI